MSAVATNPEMLVAPNVFNNAQNVMFRPVSSIATFGGPPAPQSMLESKTGKRAHATGCTFPTLIGGRGGHIPEGKYHTFFLTQEILSLNAIFCVEPVAILEGRVFFRCNTDFWSIYKLKEEPSDFLFQVSSRRRSYGGPGRGVVT